jgi:flagellar basal body-associated protein FliL
MARTVERNDGVTTERVTDDGAPNTTYVEAPARGGGGLGGVLAVIVVIAALAIAAYFFLSMSRNDTIRTQSVSDAASSVAGSASRAADNVGQAAQGAATPAAPASK